MSFLTKYVKRNSLSKSKKFSSISIRCKCYTHEVLQLICLPVSEARSVKIEMYETFYTCWKLNVRDLLHLMEKLASNLICEQKHSFMVVFSYWLETIFMAHKTRTPNKKVSCICSRSWKINDFKVPQCIEGKTEYDGHFFTPKWIPIPEPHINANRAG